MTNNDCLRRVRYILDLDDSEMINIFALVDQSISRETLCALLKKDEDPDFEECPDILLSSFLNGLIIEKRGKKEGDQPEPENLINNNMIFRKLRIAFDLKADEILSLLSKADCQISKHELSALFRNPKNRQFRQCKDQILRNFLSALQIHYRDEKKSSENIWGKNK